MNNQQQSVLKKNNERESTTKKNNGNDLRVYSTLKTTIL